MRKVLCAALCIAAVMPSTAKAAGNGQLAASFGADSLVTFNADGTGRRTVWRAPSDTDSVTDPAWSPDGNAIAFDYWDLAHGSRIAVYDLRTGLQRLVTDHPGPSAEGHTQDTAPGWTPDGRVAFLRSTYGTETAERRLMTVAADGSGLAALPLDPIFDTSVVWSSDGWVLHHDSRNALHAASIDGDGEEILPLAVRFPAAWSPDGGWLAFARKGIRAVSLDGETVDVTSPDGDESDAYPAWSPDSSALVYVHSTPLGYGIAEAVRVLDLASGAQRTVLAGNYHSPVWQPCVAGVTVSCASQAAACLQPGQAPGWDPQPLCPDPHFKRPAPFTPPPIAPAVTAQLNGSRVLIRFVCPAKCTLSARVNVRLTTGRVLKTRTVVRSKRSYAFNLNLPAIPKRRRIATVRVVGTLDARPVAISVKR